jgi:hypothetical protein
MTLENIGVVQKVSSSCCVSNIILTGKKIDDAAWEDCVALVPIAVLTTATENREQEVI